MLTPDQLRSFHLDGFLALPEPVASPDELARLRAVYDRLFASDAGRADGNQFDLAGADDDAPMMPQILAPDRYAPDLIGPSLAAVDAVAKALLGPEVEARIFHAILKPARSAAATPWHQDEAYWSPASQYQSISIWMPLQDVTEANGCMCFMPGSHEWEVLEHRSIGGDSGVHGLELVDADVVHDAVACPLPAGGLVIHRNRTAHYAGPNASDAPRRALIMSAARPERAYPAPRRFPWNERKRVVGVNGARAA